MLTDVALLSPLYRAEPHVVTISVVSYCGRESLASGVGYIDHVLHMDEHQHMLFFPGDSHLCGKLGYCSQLGVQQHPSRHSISGQCLAPTCEGWVIIGQLGVQQPPCEHQHSVHGLVIACQGFGDRVPAWVATVPRRCCFHARVG